MTKPQTRTTAAARTAVAPRKRGRSDRSVATWLAAAEADAGRRRLPGLKPILRQFAVLTEALRAASWNGR